MKTDIPSRRAENTEATRRAIFDAALALFTRRGYAETSTEEIVRRARVTRGALYHHYKDKQDLFRAVVEELNARMSVTVAERALARKDVWSAVVEGTEAFLDGCLDPAYQRIILLDGPSVLGWEEWREIGERHGLGIIRKMIDEAMSHGVIDKQPAEPLAHLFHGAFHEAAIYIARSPDVPAARAHVGESVLRLLKGIRRPKVAKRKR